MELEEYKKNMCQFLKDSNTFSGLLFRGFYEMDTEIFLSLFKEYIETGNNYLDDYSRMTYISWSVSYGDYLSDEDIQYIIRIIDNKNSRFNLSDFCSEKECEKIMLLVEEYKSMLSYEYRRKTANSKIQSKKIRKKVFKRDGMFCNICGTKDDLSIDHIISVVDGGGNNLENLQVLCKSCNSKKYWNERRSMKGENNG